MALVGHISGSKQSNSVIGVSGSVIIANRPDDLFPSLPGTDVRFFLSGSNDLLNTSVIGGYLVNSGSLYVSGPGEKEGFRVLPDSGAFSGIFLNHTDGSTKFNVFQNSGNGTFEGNLAVNGGTLSTSKTTFSLINTTATTLNIGGAATSVNLGNASGLVTIPGSLKVNGTVTYINTTNLAVKDSIIGFGFDDTLTAQTAGDRGWIGGQSGESNVAVFYDRDESEFAVALTSSDLSDTEIIVGGYGPFHAGDIQGSIVSASLGFSGSLTTLLDGTSYLIAGSGIDIVSASNGPVTISVDASVGDVSGPASSTQYAVALFDDTTGKVLRNSGLVSDATGNVLTVTTDLTVNGNTDLGDAPTDTITFTARADSSLLPITDNFYDLGSADNRWANVYTGDLHLKNDRGDYTLIEEEDMLTIRFNKTGKRYKFLLESVPQFDEEPKLNF